MGTFSIFNIMAYCDYNNLNNLIFKNLYKIPSDVDLIVCIPRSGMIIGTILSEYRNIPCCTIFEFLNNVDTEKGTIFSQAKQFNHNIEYKHILLVDDTCSSGKTLMNIKAKMKNVKSKITTFTPFAEGEGKNIVDIYIAEANWPLFPYSVLKMSLQNSCCDIDGVLTEEVPAEIDDDGEKYINFITNQRPLYIPNEPIYALVTGRMEKYRNITETWLKNHNIKYTHLFMCPAKNKLERITMNPAIFKATIFKNVNIPTFIESSYYEASIIKQITNKEVFCTDIMEYI